MNYYHNLITDKSWRLLRDLVKKYDFILIGGWAVFLYTKALKSKDVDIVLEHNALMGFKEDFEVFKNDRLKKYEAKKEEIDIDIYIPFYSNPGIPAEELINYAVIVEGFKVVRKEILAVLKVKTLSQRGGSVKGRKDLVDLVSLFSLPDFDWNMFKNSISKNILAKELAQAEEIIKKTTSLEELNLNVHKMARFKKKLFTHL
ncbi:MAG: hypothetical protein AAB685_00375 [Patescibacteria group bacterium]